MKSDYKILVDQDLLFEEGDASNGLYLIQEGTIEIFRKREGAEVILSVINAGGIVGTMTLISRAPRTASARAVGSCKLAFFANEGLRECFNNIPVWAQAIIKETISSVKSVNDKLMEAKLKERTLLRNIGNVYQHSSQLAYLLATLIRKGTILDDDNIPIYQMKDFLIQAEFILLKKFSYLEQILTLFLKNGLVKVTQHQPYGLVIIKPRPELLEDYANFSVGIVRKGTAHFVPTKFYKWMGALLRISKRFHNLEKFSRDQLSAFLKAELTRNDIPIIIALLAQYNIIKEDENLISFSTSKLQKIIVFEGIAKSLKDMKF